MTPRHRARISQPDRARLRTNQSDPEILELKRVLIRRIADLESELASVDTGPVDEQLPTDFVFLPRVNFLREDSMWIAELTARISLCRSLLKQVQTDPELDLYDPSVVKLRRMIQRRLNDLELILADIRLTEARGIADKTITSSGRGDYFLYFSPDSKSNAA